MFVYYTVCYFTCIFYAVVKPISMLFIDNKDSVSCIPNVWFILRCNLIQLIGTVRSRNPLTNLRPRQTQVGLTFTRTAVKRLSHRVR